MFCRCSCGNTFASGSSCPICKTRSTVAKFGITYSAAQQIEQAEASVVAQRRKRKGFNSFLTLAASPSAVPFHAFRGQSRSISSDNERLNSSGGFLVSPYTTYLYAPTHAPQPPAFVASLPVESSLAVDTVFGFNGTLPSMMAGVRDSSDIVYVPLLFVFVPVTPAQIRQRKAVCCHVSRDTHSKNLQLPLSTRHLHLPASFSPSLRLCSRRSQRPHRDLADIRLQRFIGSLC